MPEYKDKTRYNCVITDQTFGTSAKKGTPYFRLRFKVLHEITSPSEMSPVPRELECECTFWLTEKAMEYVQRDLATLGFPEDCGPDELDLNHNPHHSFIDQEKEFYCQYEDFEIADKETGRVEKKTKMQWSVGTPGGGSLPPMEHATLAPAKMRELNALFGKGNKAKIVSRPRTVTASAPATGVVTNAHGVTVSDQDCPF